MLIKPNILSALSATNRTMESASERLSTGKRINRASDDPIGFVRLAQTQSSLSRTSVNLSVLSRGMDRLNARDEVLGSMQDVMGRFQELTVMARSPFYKASDIVPEMRALKDAMVSLANTKDMDGHMFSGGSNVRPFSQDATGATQYDGSTAASTVVLEGVSISGSINGQPLLEAFQGMESVLADVEAGNPVSQAAAEKLEVGAERLINMRAIGGAQAAGAQQIINNLTKKQDREKSEINNLETADPVAETIRFTEASRQYEAILKITGMQLNQRRLMDFI